jgi:hypothetical protein
MVFCFALILSFIIAAMVDGQTDIFHDCESEPLASFPICNQLLPVRERATDLVRQMTIDEKYLV